MKKMRIGTAVTLICAGIIFGWVMAGQGPGTNVTEAASNGLTAQDYADIQQLYWRYNQGADFRDGALFVSAFSDDARFTAGGQTIVGQDDLTAWRVQRDEGKTGDNGRRHWNSSYRITQSAGGAEGLVYWMLIDVSSGAPQQLASGYYEDEYEKTSSGWRIKQRILRPDAG